VKDCWDNPDPHRRLRERADTFSEFEARVQSFMNSIEIMPDGAAVYGYGKWFGLLHWPSLGYRVRDAGDR
jgi:hypothetical protein